MDYLVYLSGPITGLTYDDSEDWRGRISAMLHPSILTLSPLRGKHFLRGEGVLSGSYDHNPASTQKGIMGRDRNDCLRASALIVNLLGTSKVSVGTVMEIAWADLHRVPIVLIMEKAGNIHDHPMLKEAVTYWVDNLDDAAKFTELLLLSDDVLSAWQDAAAPKEKAIKPPLNTGRQIWGGGR